MNLQYDLELGAITRNVILEVQYPTYATRIKRRENSQKICVFTLKDYIFIIVINIK